MVTLIYLGQVPQVKGFLNDCLGFRAEQELIKIYCFFFIIMFLVHDIMIFFKNKYILFHVFHNHLYIIDTPGASISIFVSCQ